MYRVEISHLGESYVCDGQQSLLRAMEQLGRRGIPVGCRNGGCGVCKVRITEGSFRCGKMSAAHVSEQDAQEGVVLACKAYPLSDVRLELAAKLQRCLTREPREDQKPAPWPQGGA